MSFKRRTFDCHGVIQLTIEVKFARRRRNWTVLVLGVKPVPINLILTNSLLEAVADFRFTSFILKFVRRRRRRRPRTRRTRRG